MATGVGTVSALSTLVQQTYDPVFETLRDKEATFMALFPKTSEDNDKARWHLEANDSNPVWSYSETQMTQQISNYDGAGATLLHTDGVGTAARFLAPNVHVVLEAVQTIRHIAQTIELSGKLLASVKGKPGAFKNALTEETRKSLEDWNRQINDMMISWATTSGNSGLDIDGLGVLFTAVSGSYAGINHGTYTEHKPYVSVNGGDADGSGGTNRALTIALLQDMFEKLEGMPSGSTYRRGKVKKILGGVRQYNNYGNLLSAQRRYMDKGMDAGFPTLEFEGRAFVKIPKFNANRLLFLPEATAAGSPPAEYRVLKSMDVADHSQLIADGKLLIMTHYANFLAKGRMETGVLANLT